MKLLVLPPHRDVTLVPEAPAGWHCVDVAREFCRRVFAPTAVEAEAQLRERSPATAQSMRELLLLRAAQALWAREDSSPHTGLRARGAVLTAISGPPQGVHLRLDDVELEGGTTERSADVLRAMDAPVAYLSDLVQAAERFADAERVRLWIDRDLQLPAAAWLARACPRHVPLEVAGPFAWQHREVLQHLSVFQRAAFVDAPLLGWYLAGEFRDAARPRLAWIPESLGLRLREAPEALTSPVASHGALGTCVPEAVRAFTGDARWAGHVSLDSLLRPGALRESGCEVAIVGFCAIIDGDVVDPWGARIPHAALVQGAHGFRESGGRVVAEWWVGAPGIDADALEATLTALDGEPLFDHVSGVRPFHWTRMTPPGGPPRLWRDVRVGAPPEDRDLARSLPFEHAGSIPSSSVPQALAGLASRLLARAPLSPGRVAAACLPDATAPVTGGGEARGIRLDADCALVQLPASLDGAARASWYAANLRTGAVLAMDARLAPKLAGLTRPGDVAHVLGTVPEAQRAKLVDTLVARSVLTKVNG
ncbi:hypothetical protein [Comamonas sp. JC664]|uniref:hypothetical protein n=1 Tax=Comamonas sp. JC664 TaxID=2801917 RepID=UPI001748FB1D|nr:hypothetical protein [Comamonas sp. JC664]MBL0696587.1 hypothetical protein [Comamonas sp. JC664]GHG84980.1 hypothetical protein GCM10012319_41170 [Comamonas sp. KCTC 72670]